MNNSFVSLFHAQAYKDSWADYQRSLNEQSFVCWDYIIITASNEQQAEGFRSHIAERISMNVLPSRTHYAVLPDPGGKRVGSGGATLNVIRYVAQREKSTDFSRLRILVIHSGGDSKRVPQYSALGKLFSPVPHELPDRRSSTLFDEFIIGLSGVPSRISSGMMLLSGDVLLLFNPLQIDFSGDGAAAVSFKEDVETGKNHGVYLKGEDGKVAKCLQKQSVEKLRSLGAVNEMDCVDIDTGAVIFSPEMISSLYGLISSNGVFSDEKFDQFVNDTVRLSLYADFLYPLGSDATLESFYTEKPEGDFSDELTVCRTAVWEALHPYQIQLLCLAPAKFIHFGTTSEIMKLMSDDIEQYKFLGWSSCVNSSISAPGVAGYNSIFSGDTNGSSNIYLEASYVHRNAKVGSNVLLSYVNLHDEVIPDNVVLHAIKTKDGRFVVRIYGIDDNPKDILENGCPFLGSDLASLMEKNGITTDELWSGGGHYLWTAELYPACKTIKEGISAALNLYDMANGSGDVNKWRAEKRKSLCSGFNEADPQALTAWNHRMKELVLMDKLFTYIKEHVPVSEANHILGTNKLSRIQTEWLESHLKSADFSERIRLQYYVGRSVNEKEGERYIADCFQSIKSLVVKGSLQSISGNKSCHITMDKHTVRLPLRVNWGGGWSDTPPYCVENGGTALNAAILLNGKMPVEVNLEKLPERKIVFESHDMKQYGEFTDIRQLQSVGNPFDPFVLQKSALLACGIIPTEGGKLEDILELIGGGFRMNTEVTNVPKGSGLGTSSILAAACVKALFEFMGIPFDESSLYRHVSAMEQMMSTGGGWQDQVGGLTCGIKYITTMPGMVQEIKVHHVNVPEKAMADLRERFFLIYTGQRRLARNLLRDVVGRYIGNEKQAVYALNEIQRVAALMRFELERGRIDAFAELLNRHWELSKMIDSGSTNTLIDQIFSSVDEFIDGKLVCGAGGGGFLQVVLKKGVLKEDVHNRLKSVFQDSNVDIYECTLI